MCMWSSEHVSRRARAGETAEIRRAQYHRILRPTQKVGDEDCICLKTGDTIQFRDLPLDFQKQYAVPPNAVAVFIEAKKHNGQRDHQDRFDFQNSNIVPMSMIPMGTKCSILQLADQPALPVRRAVDTDAIDDPIAEELDAPDVSLPAGVLRGAMSRPRVVGIASLVTIALAYLGLGS